MNIQSVQESLNYLILVITAFSIIVMLVDFMVGLVHLWHQVALNVEYCTTHKTSEQSNIEPIDTTNSNLNVEQENCHPSANYNSVVNSYPNSENDNCNQLSIIMLQIVLSMLKMTMAINQMIALLYNQNLNSTIQLLLT